MTEQNIIMGFDPIVDEKTKVVILGTLPGPESLQFNEYYKKSSNCFWRLIYSIFDKPLSNNYSEKCSFLLEHNLGVWDIFHYARRSGFSDSDISDAELNDFEAFFKKYPLIKGIIFNGKLAEEKFKKLFPELYKKIRKEKVLSSSGASAKTFEEKLKNWYGAINKFTGKKHFN